MTTPDHTAVAAPVPVDTAAATRRWWRTPVMAWAAVGVAFLVAEVWLMSRWAGTQARWFPSGNYGLSATGTLVLGTYQVLSIAGVASCVLWPVWHSVRRRALTIEAMVLIGYLTAFWLMPIVNYGGQMTSYSKYLVGTTDWGPFLPGWHGPDPETHSIPLFVGWFALAEVMMWTLPTVWVLRAVVRRRPHLSGPRLGLIALAAAMGAELVLEPVMVFTGAYVYVSAVPGLTLFAGHWYQIPSYAMVIAAVVYGVIPGLICHHHRHHPRGAPVLRGVAALPTAARPWVATVAVIGAAQLSFLGLAVSYAVIPALGGLPATDLPTHLQ